MLVIPCASEGSNDSSCVDDRDRDPRASGRGDAARAPRHFTPLELPRQTLTQTGSGFRMTVGPDEDPRPHRRRTIFDEEEDTSRRRRLPCSLTVLHGSWQYSCTAPVSA